MADVLSIGGFGREKDVDAIIGLRRLSESARDGAEALDFLFCRDTYQDRDPVIPRVILLDLKLPKVDGLEVLRQLRADERTRLMPVVVMTSSRQESDVVEAYKLGINSYIVKPVDFEQFTESVRQIGYYWLLLNQPPKL